MRSEYTLDSKYLLESGWVYLTGIQALVRLPLDQMRRDRRAGLHTGCYISGYEGSPLGGYDLALQRVSRLLSEHDVHFDPGVNEDLAATAVMGSQITETLPGARYDGVVGIWYGKGPGVDRSGDALRHANLAGTGKNGGALALAGDDHVSKSSTIPHQSEFSLYNVGIPTLSAGTTQQVLDFGLLGIEMSRFSGAWTGLKLATDVCDGGGMVEISPERLPVVRPEFLVDGRPYEKLLQPLLIVPNSWALEREMLGHRLEAARLFAYENKLNRIVARGPDDKVGIVVVGKSFPDLATAFANLGLDEAAIRRLGVRVLNLGMVFPLEPHILDQFADGLDEIFAIEEKRPFVETQLRDHFYDRRPQPAIFGKRTPEGEPLLDACLELDAEKISRALERWLGGENGFRRRMAQLEAIEVRVAEARSAGSVPARGPGYCSGCPHNRSTLVLEGQIAGGGIGCHGMAARLSHAGRGIAYIGHMGSEGAHWVGMAPFTETPHIFQNIGDGTYFHSGRQAVLAAVAAGVNVTYKILYNSAVAMTGGQDAAGAIPIPPLTRQLDADGVRKIVVLTEDVSRYRDRSELAEGVEVRPRERLEETLRELEKEPGVTALIYDQMCAAERRRKRNRGKLPRPVRRLMIDERVCEGCGDCVKKSNCVSLTPVDTPWGPRTRIHQSSCNTDYSCLLGDCPSFVSVYVEEGTGLKRRALPDLPEVEVPEPEKPRLGEEPCHVLMPGIGGTGVVTVNALLATAALLDGLFPTTLDQTGLSQKGGAVVGHLAISRDPIVAANRISFGSADLLLGFDLLGAAAPQNLRLTSPERTSAVVNTEEVPTAESVRQGLTILSADAAHLAAIGRSTKRSDSVFLNASRLADQLFGSHLQTNLLLVGAAYQAGKLPLSRESIEQAIRLNGVQVERNLEAFHWGRAAVADPARVEAVAGAGESKQEESLGQEVERYARELALYQNRVYASRYRDFVDRIRPHGEELTAAVAHNLYRLMAYKDEYEVARLLGGGAIEARARETFEAPRKVVYHLHPPALRALGFRKKLALGAWVRPLLRLLAGMSFLRGTPLDPFGRTASRRLERELIVWYRGAVEQALEVGGAALALEVARAADGIRGYEDVKKASADAVRARVTEMLTQAAQRPAA